MVHSLQRASAVYLAASVVPQARRAIRRRRVVFRREVPSNTHRVASHPCRARRLHHGRKKQYASLRPREPHMLSTPGRASYFSPRLCRRLIACVLAGHKRRLWLQSADGGLYRSCYSVARQPCRSLACASRRQQQSQRCRTSHTTQP